MKCTVRWLPRKTRVPGHSAKKRDLERACLGPSDGADILPKGVSLCGPSPVEGDGVVACS